jgi:diacylglycerol kinase family enzyme
MTYGNSFHLLANSKSGQGGGSTLLEKAETISQELGVHLNCYPLEPDHGFEQQILKAVANALQDGGVVIAAGGDGTIRSVAQAVHGKNLRFAVVPCGTFNFFARAHQIPEENEQALRLALTGEARPVRLGEVNGHVFLINASLGLYAQSVREREVRTDLFGRSRIVVILSTLLSFLSPHRLLHVDLISEGIKRHLRTPMIFIGNNALQLRGLEMSVAHCMKQDLLAVVMMKPVRKRDLFRILVRGVLKILEDDLKVDSFCVDQLTIEVSGKAHLMALDGELIPINSPIQVRSRPDDLYLVQPPITKGEA